MPRVRPTIPVILIGVTILYLLLWSPGYSLRQSSGASKHGNTIVMATMKGKDVSWVKEELPDWQHAIYVTNDLSAPLHTKRNKGHEANVYLSYLIQNYDKLPEVAVFLHHHRNADHQEQILDGTPDAIHRLNLDYVKSVGYHNLNCGGDYVCEVTTSTRVWWSPTKEVKEAWPHIFPNEELPEFIHGECCAQFAVSRERMLANSKADYLRMHNWLMTTEMDDFYSGRVFEYVWHRIFGKPHFDCKPRDICFCEAYAICDLGSHSAAMGRPEDPAALRAKQLVDNADLAAKLKEKEAEAAAVMKAA